MDVFFSQPSRRRHGKAGIPKRKATPPRHDDMVTVRFSSSTIVRIRNFFSVHFYFKISNYGIVTYRPLRCNTVPKYFTEVPSVAMKYIAEIFKTFLRSIPQISLPTFFQQLVEQLLANEPLQEKLAQKINDAVNGVQPDSSSCLGENNPSFKHISDSDQVIIK